MSNDTPSKPASTNPKNTDSPAETHVREGLCDPHRLAKAYLRARCLPPRFDWALKYWRQDWWVWDGRRYCRWSALDLRAEVTTYVKELLDRWTKAAAAKSADDEEKATVPPVTSSLITNVLRALSGLVLVPTTIDQPAWIGRSSGRGTVIAMSNGLVDLEGLLAGKTDVLRRHCPNGFPRSVSTIPMTPAPNVHASGPSSTRCLNPTQNESR